jgi:protocatechuate 3,4-dioxygenase beta subunit
MRTAIGSLAAGAALAYCAALPLTAQEHEAPPNAPSRVEVADRAEPGARMLVRGRVVREDGQTPIAGASIYVYQTDATGRYAPGNARDDMNPRLKAYLRSDASGRYEFSTVRPGSYPGTTNPGHIHYVVSAPGYERRITEIVFEGDTLIPPQFRQQASSPLGGVAIVQVVERNGVQETAFDVRLRGR